MRYMRLVEPTLVIVEQKQGLPYWSPHALARGTVVGVMQHTKPSVVTGRKDEIYVRWHDVVGRASMGWLPKKVQLTRSNLKELKYVTWNPEGKLTSWDTLREHVFFNKGWTLVQYLNKFADKETVPLLHAVIRELGGKVPRSDDPRLAIRLVLKHVNPKENINMSKNRAVAEQDEDVTPVKASKKGKKGTAKKSAAKKSVSKKAAKREGGPGRTSMYSTKRIIKLVKTNPRREDTHGYNSWELLRKGMTYEQYIEAGGRRVDLAWDILKGNVKLAKA